MREHIEAELRVALTHGLVSRAEAEALRGESNRLGRSPLELLREKGRISEQALISFRAQARGGGNPAPDAADQTATADRPVGEQGPASPGQAKAAEPAIPAGAGSKPAPSSEPPAFPVSRWDRYQYVRFLGQGGMGQVFLAYDMRLRRNVALKFVRGDDAELSRRIISEARAQARVNHERVCKVYEVGEVEGHAFIAMQYIDGQPLSALASELSVEQKVLVVRGAADGVAEAHRVGLIHRDLKPSNIMVERAEDGTLKPYVMDFGLARDWNQKDTATGSVVGTPHYMAPEQARGEVATLDRRADVYSLGATLYSVLCGHPPILGSNGLEIIANIATQEPRRLRELHPDIPVDLEVITFKCLEKDRSARYDSARALAQELDRFLAGDPILARADGTWYRLRKRLRKHRALVSVTGVALTLVLLALGWAALQRREVLERERLARRFTELVERVESSARYSELSPPHDIRADQQVLRARMAELEAEIRAAGAQAAGPGHYALGRGHLALGDDVRGHEHLQAAWERGFREPRVAYALAVVTGRQYQAELLDAERIREPERREARKRELERRYRDPALAYLRRSQGAEVPSAEYVAALLAFYEGRWEDALAKVDAIGDRLPWFYEAPKLRGDILLARATRRWNAGERDGANADFEAGRQAYAAAADIGRSAPAVHAARGELEYAAMVMELYGQGEVMPPFSRGMEAASRALMVQPDDAQAHLLRARLQRRLAEARGSQGTDTEGVLQEAITAAERAIKLDPARAQARLELGRSHWLLGRLRQARNVDPREQLRDAVAAFEQVPAAARDAGFHMQLGLVFNVWADYEGQSGGDPLPNQGKAIEAYRTALELDGSDFDTWMNLGIVYFTRASHPRASAPDGDLAQARVAFDKARPLNPAHVGTWYYAGEVRALAAKRNQARGADAGPELAEALEMYRRGAGINPKIPHFYNGMGLATLQQARAAWDRGADPFALVESAKGLFEQTVQVAPDFGIGHHNIGEALAQRAWYQRARGEDLTATVRAAAAAIREALQRIPKQAPPWSNLGMVHALQAGFELEHGRDPGPSLARASEALEKALGLNPQDAQALHYRSEVAALRARWRAKGVEHGGADFERAAADFQKALEVGPSRPDTKLGFGLFCLEWASWRTARGQAPDAVLSQGLEVMDKALAQRPGWPDARLIRAGLRLARGESSAEPAEQARWRSGAREDVLKALAGNPRLEQAWRGQGELVRRMATLWSGSRASAASPIP